MERNHANRYTTDLCGRKATLNMNKVKHSELRSCVKVEVVVVNMVFNVHRNHKAY